MVYVEGCESSLGSANKIGHFLNQPCSSRVARAGQTLATQDRPSPVPQRRQNRRAKVPAQHERGNPANVHITPKRATHK